MKHFRPLAVAFVVACTGALATAQPADVSSLPAAESAPAGSRVAMGEIFFLQRHPATRGVEWIGTAIIWSLVGLSAVSVSLIGARLYENRREQIMPPELVGRGEALLRDGRLSEFNDFVRQDNSDFSRAFAVGLARQQAGEEAVNLAIDEFAQATSARRLRRLEPLNIIGNVGPMIGLFATVYGMILVFRAIVAAGGTPDPSNLAAGIGTKLVGTFWGLVVAIPALSAYALLRNRVEGFTADAADAAKRLLARLRASAERTP